MTAPELKPCPFCGGEASHNGGGGSVFGRFWWTVGCKACDVWFADPEVWSNTGHGMLNPAYPPKHCFAAWNTRAPDADLTARLAAAEAERDAAVARAKALADSYSKPFAAQVAEGERRATAAIVADLREFAASDRAKHFADRYEAGDHLKGTSNE